MKRESVRIVMLAAVGLLGAFFVGLIVWQLLPSQSEDCARDQRFIGKSPSGDEVMERDEVCDGGLAHSDAVTLVLQPRHGLPVAFFSYSPSYVPNIAEPIISWTSSNMTIRIARVGEVYFRRDQARNYGVRYEIGHVDAD